MLPILRHTHCAACGHRHTFGLPAGDWPVGIACDYVCPETGHKATLTLGTVAETAQYHPQGAVQLTPRPGTATAP